MHALPLRAVQVEVAPAEAAPEPIPDVEWWDARLLTDKGASMPDIAGEWRLLHVVLPMKCV